MKRQQKKQGKQGRGSAAIAWLTLQVAWLSISCHVGSSRFLSAMTPCSATNTISRAALCMLTARSYRKAAFCVSCWAWGERVVRIGRLRGSLRGPWRPILGEDKRKKSHLNVGFTFHTMMRINVNQGSNILQRICCKGLA